MQIPLVSSPFQTIPARLKFCLRACAVPSLVVALSTVTGCAGSLMHGDTVAAKRAAREGQASAPERVETPVFETRSAPVPALATRPEVSPAPAALPAQATPTAQPEVEAEPIVVTGAVPRKPKPPVPPVYPNTSATIAFTIRPTQNCPTCQLSKISVSPTGQVLIELGHWNNVHREWDYQHYGAKVKRNTANAFAASLNAIRPVGAATRRIAGLACNTPTRDDGLTIEWIEFGRRDFLDVTFDCSASGDSQLAQQLRHAPNILGLPRIAVP